MTGNLRPDTISDAESYHSLPDEALATVAAAGNRAAIEELTARVYPIVHRFYIKLTRSAQDSQDLTQSAMIRMIENLGRYRPSEKSKFQSWVFRLSYNLFIDQTRRKKATPTDDQILRQVPDMRDAHAQTEQRQEAQLLLDGLPEELRAMVILRYYMDMGYQEIAKAMDTTEKRVKWRLHDAMERMRRMHREGAE